MSASKARVSPILARLAVEARAAATKAREEADEAASAAGSHEEMIRARAEANGIHQDVKKVERELIALEVISDGEHKNYSTARMDANRLRSAREQADADSKAAHATALKMAGTLEAASHAFEVATVNKENAEDLAATRWDESAAAAERAQVMLEAAEMAASEAADAARAAANAGAKREGCQQKLIAAEREHAEVESTVGALVRKSKEAATAAEAAAEQAAAPGGGTKGGARAAWDLQQTKKAASAAAEAAETGMQALPEAVKRMERAKRSLAESVEEEAPLVTAAAELDTIKVSAQEVAQRTDLEAKNADAVARKAEQSARVARSAHQAAQSKLARETPAKETADEAVVRAEEALAAAKTKCEVADQKEYDCDVSATAAKAATEAKQAALQLRQSEAKAAEAKAANLEALAEAAKAAEEVAEGLHAEAEAAEARQYESGMLLECTSTVASMCKVLGSGIATAYAGEPASFTIEARDVQDERQPHGGDLFFVRVRHSGQGTRVAANVADHNDGKYTVSFKPPVHSGRCSISVSLLGSPLPGSPFSCHVRARAPSASQSSVGGDALARIVAGHKSSFVIRFRDEFGAPAPACELDVWAEPRQEASASELLEVQQQQHLLQLQLQKPQHDAALAPSSLDAALDSSATTPSRLSSSSNLLPDPAMPSNLQPAALVDPIAAQPHRSRTSSYAEFASPTSPGGAPPELSSLPGSPESGSGRVAGGNGSGSGGGGSGVPQSAEQGAMLVATAPLDLTVSAEPRSTWLGKIQPGQVSRHSRDSDSMLGRPHTSPLYQL